MFASVAAQVPPVYANDYLNEALYTYVLNEYTNAMLGRKTPAQAVKDATANLKKAIAQGS